MKKTLISALALSIALGVGAAMARGMQDHGPRTLPSFAELDRNGNGEVTLEDLQAFGAARRAEMEAKRAERMKERAAKMDERRQRMFDRVDANGDGVVDAGEYAAFTDRMEERMEQRGKRGWGRH
jgi:Ca2+-binding EF-hand superfamily protein